MSLINKKPVTKTSSEKKQIQKDFQLDAEEQDLLESFERGEWETTSNSEEEKLFAKNAAANYLRKDVRINIRLSSNDLELIKERAAFEGLPYQTLAASVLHKFAAGHL